MFVRKLLAAAVGVLACAAAACAADGAPAGKGLCEFAKGPQDPVARFNVVYDSPGKDFFDSMPTGNGDIGVSAWVEQDGDLVFFLSKTDSYDDNYRLLKLGKVRVSFAPNPFAKGGPFRQELVLRDGLIVIDAGQGESAVSVRLWADANHPVVRIESAGPAAKDMKVRFETWRTEPKPVKLTHSDVYNGNGAIQTIQYPDVIVGGLKDRIAWYHRNEHSSWPVTMKLQGLESLMKEMPDPLAGLTFGGTIVGEGMVSDGPTVLKSAQPLERRTVSIHVLTAQAASAQAWQAALDKQMAATSTVDPAAAAQAHREWWRAFWDRSWLRISGPALTTPVTRTTLPVRIGADGSGATRFKGRMARVRLWSSALKDEPLARLAAAGRFAPADKSSDLVAEYALGELKDGSVANQAGAGLAAKAVGDLAAQKDGEGSVLRFDGRGYLEIAHDPRLDLAQGFTLEAWIQPEQFDGGGARIIDKSQVGSNQAYLLDTYPGNSLRSITAAGTLRHDAKLQPGRWVHVAGTFGAGKQRLWVDGKCVAEQPAAGMGDPQSVVSRGYALQRYLTACGGRGPMWVKYNGSIFTLPWEQDDPDYRRWGGAQWFQNARLPYWPLIACGDYDVTASFWRPFVAMLPLCRAKTKIYYGHEGAFFPETQYHWGTYANGDYGWNRANVPLGFAVNNYIRWYWTGGLELLTMMLDQYANTQDEAFLTETLLPVATEVLRFYDQHWKRGADGKILFEPAQSLETWHQATNPLPEIAGLGYVIPRMLALPAEAATPAQRQAWRKTLADLPALPRRTEKGKTFILPAQKYDKRSNSENPELYGVFPYRVFGVGKDELEVGINTLDRRANRQNICWWQNEIHLAYLGQAQEAGKQVSGRFASINTRFRFPVMWGPFNDEIPDMDHGGSGMMALQVMLMQCEGEKILLFPAWPKPWDVEFKLHAPRRTIVQGVYRGGKLEQLQVTPSERAKDVVRCEPQ